jgi:DNA invertase Pin-like site-specific DNA recombinase
MPTIYGYARASDPKQVASCDVQEANLQAAASDIEGTWGKTFRDEAVSGMTKPFEKRKGAKALLDVLQADDHVVVVRADRLGRKLVDILNTILLLRSRGVTTHILQFNGRRVDLDDQTAFVLVTAFGTAAQLEGMNIQDRTKDALAYKKASGLAYTGNPGYGKRRVWLDADGNEIKVRLGTDWVKRNKHRAETKLDLWDQAECDQIREIYHRITRGETHRSVAEDFKRRGELTANGEPWVGRRPDGRLDYARVSKVYHWYRRLRAQGHEIGGLDTADLRGLVNTDIRS